MPKTYIHYGHDFFDKSRFHSVTNCRYFNKPSYGFWGSPVDAGKSWEEFVRYECDHNMARRLEKSFQFQIAPEARVLEIHSVEDAREISERFPYTDERDMENALHLLCIDPTVHVAPMLSIDFEAVSKEYDAVEVFYSEDYRLQVTVMNMWDCDSIVVFNPDVVVQCSD